MPFVPAVVAFAATELGVTAAISGALIEAGATAIVADVATGAIIGAGSGAISSAVQGGDIAQGALIGAATGGVGAGVSGALTQALGGDTLSAGLQGPVRAPELGGSTSLAGGAIKGLTGAVTGGLGAALGGGDPLRGALLGGAGGAATGYLGPELGLSKTESAALGGGLNYLLGQAFAPDPATRAAVSGSAVTPSTPTSTVSGQVASTTPSTLGGALLASPTLGYTPGSSFLGGTDSSKPAQNVWNQASLKEGAKVGPSSDGSEAQSS